MELDPTLRGKLEIGAERPPEYGPIRLDLKSHSLQLIGSDEQEALGPKEYQLLWLLVRAHGNVITEGEFMEFVYGDESDEKDLPVSNTMAVLIGHVRTKLDELTHGRVTIENIRNHGYSLALK